MTYISVVGTFNINYTKYIKSTSINCVKIKSVYAVLFHRQWRQLYHYTSLKNMMIMIHNPTFFLKFDSMVKTAKKFSLLSVALDL